MINSTEFLCCIFCYFFYKYNSLKVIFNTYFAVSKDMEIIFAYFKLAQKLIQNPYFLFLQIHFQKVSICF